MKLLIGAITRAQLEGAEQIAVHMAEYAKNNKEMAKFRAAATDALETFLRKRYPEEKDIRIDAIELLMLGDLFIGFALRALADKFSEKMWALTVCFRNDILVYQGDEHEAQSDIEH